MEFLSINIDSNQKYSSEYLGEGIVLFNEKCEGLLTSNFYKNIFKNYDKKLIAVLTKIELKVQKCIKLNLSRLFSLSKGIYRLANLNKTNVNANKSSLLIILRKLKTISCELSTISCELKMILRELKMISCKLKMISRDVNLFYASLKRFHATLKRFHATLK